MSIDAEEGQTESLSHVINYHVINLRIMLLFVADLVY